MASLHYCLHTTRLKRAFGLALIVGGITAGSLASGGCSAEKSCPAASDAAALFEPEASFLSGTSSADSRNVLAAFRRHCRSQQPPTLHLITPTSGLNKPEALMTEGFVIWNYPAVPVQPPIDWAADPFNDVSWKYQFNTLIFLDPLLHACEKSPDPKLLRFAVNVCRDWIRQNWARKDNPNQFAWYDMAVGVRAPKIAWLAHAAACSDDIDDAALLELLQGALRHGQELRDPANVSKDMNHGIYQMLGLLGLVRTLPDLRSFSEYEQYGTRSVEQMFTTHYCVEEGAHLEHSPAYHLYLSHLLSKSLSTGLLAGADRLQALRDRAFDVLAWMIKPDGSIVRFGDGADRRSRVSVVLPVPLRERSAAYWFALTAGTQGAPPSQEALILPKSGYAFIRGPWPTNAKEWTAASYLGFMAAFHSRTHKHADDGTFEWSELGRPILIDSGGFAYHYDLPERQYCESTRAHNTLEIDARDLSRDLSDVYGSAIKRWASTAGTHAVEAEFTRKPDIRHRRTLIYRPGEWLVVSDELMAGSEHTYSQWFHFDPELEIQVAGQGVDVPIPDTDRHLLVQSLTGASLVSVRAQQEPRLEGWTSLEYRKLTPNWAVAYRSFGANARITTLFALGPAAATLTDAAAVASGQHQLGLRWRLDGQVVEVNLRREEDELKLDVVRTGTSRPVGPAE